MMMKLRKKILRFLKESDDSEGNHKKRNIQNKGIWNPKLKRKLENFEE